MPTDFQLLHCVNEAIKQATAGAENAQQQAILGATGAIVNELLLRADVEVIQNHYLAGKKILDQGLALLEQAAEDLANNVAQLPNELSADLSNEASGQQMDHLMGCLKELISHLPSISDDSCQSFLNAVTEWEIQSYARRLEQAESMTAESINNAEVTAESFAAYLQEKFPDWGNVKVTGLTPVAGGFSKKTILADIEDDTHGKHSVAIRGQQAIPMLNLYAIEIGNEFELVKMAYGQGAKASEPLWVETDASKLGMQFMVSRKASGKVMGTAVGATETITQPMIKSLAAELAHIHQIDLVGKPELSAGTVLEPWMQYRTMKDNTLANVEYWRQMADEARIELTPLLERGLRWLEENIEDCPGHPRLLHGDYGLHNIMIHNEQVEAILDWEVCHVGDPAEELSWLLACSDEFVDAETLLGYYCEAGGDPVSEFRLRYFDVFNCIRMPVACLAALRVLDRQVDNIQTAMFGLKFMHHNTSRLVECIQKAESVKNA